MVELTALPALVRELRREVDALHAHIDTANRLDADGLLDVVEAAKVLSMTPGSLRQAVSRRTIPAIRIGRRLRFRRDDLLALRAHRGDAGSDDM